MSDELTIVTRPTGVTSGVGTAYSSRAAVLLKSLVYYQVICRPLFFSYVLFLTAIFCPGRVTIVSSSLILHQNIKITIVLPENVKKK
jgi:hypothetical protein